MALKRGKGKMHPQCSACSKDRHRLETCPSKVDQEVKTASGFIERIEESQESRTLRQIVSAYAWSVPLCWRISTNCTKVCPWLSGVRGKYVLCLNRAPYHSHPPPPRSAKGVAPGAVQESTSGFIKSQANWI